MDLLIITSEENKAKKISSVELAELCGKKHKNVLADIRRMEPSYIEVFGNGLRFELIEYTDKKGEKRPCYSLTKSQSLFVVSSYSAVIRARIQRRWEELETQSKFSIPKTYSQALMLAAKQAEQIELQQQQLAVQAPKVEYFDKLVDRKLNLCLRDTAKAIKVKQNTFIKFLEDNKYLYRNNKKQLRPYANSKAEGLFEVKEFSSEKYSSTQVLVTPKGRQTFMMLLNKE